MVAGTACAGIAAEAALEGVPVEDATGTTKALEEVVAAGLIDAADGTALTATGAGAGIDLKIARTDSYRAFLTESFSFSALS